MNNLTVSFCAWSLRWRVQNGRVQKRGGRVQNGTRKRAFHPVLPPMRRNGCAARRCTVASDAAHGSRRRGRGPHRPLHATSRRHQLHYMSGRSWSMVGASQTLGHEWPRRLGLAFRGRAHRHPTPRETLLCPWMARSCWWRSYLSSRTNSLFLDLNQSRGLPRGIEREMERDPWEHCNAPVAAPMSGRDTGLF